jgi:hypothetical protein
MVNNVPFQVGGYGFVNGCDVGDDETDAAGLHALVGPGAHPARQDGFAVGDDRCHSRVATVRMVPPSMLMPMPMLTVMVMTMAMVVVMVMVVVVMVVVVVMSIFVRPMRAVPTGVAAGFLAGFPCGYLAVFHGHDDKEGCSSEVLADGGSVFRSGGYFHWFVQFLLVHVHAIPFIPNGQYRETNPREGTGCCFSKDLLHPVSIPHLLRGKVNLSGIFAGVGRAEHENGSGHGRVNIAPGVGQM